MSDRNQDGTFAAAPSEPLTGRDSVEQAQGFVRMADPKPRDEEDSPKATIESEAERLAQFREAGFQNYDEELAYLQADGSRADSRETISLNRAAEDAKNYHQDQERDLTEIKRAVIASEVDADRAAAVGGDASRAAQFGLEINQPEAEPVTAAPEDRDAKIERLVQDADVREFLETNATRAAEAAQQAELWGRSSLLAIAPELGQLPLEQWAGAIQILAQNDPQRGQALGAMFDNVQRATLAQQQHQQQRSAVQAHQLAEYKKAEDARFVTESGKSPQEIAAISQRLPGHLNAMGIDTKTLVQAAERNPDFHSADFQKILARLDYLEVQNKSLQTAAKAVPASLPPVSRPGARTTSSIRGDTDASTIRALEKQISGASGQAAIRLGAQLLAARRK